MGRRPRKVCPGAAVQAIRPGTGQRGELLLLPLALRLPANWHWRQHGGSAGLLQSGQRWRHGPAAQLLWPVLLLVLLLLVKRALATCRGWSEGKVVALRGPLLLLLLLLL